MKEILKYLMNILLFLIPLNLISATYYIPDNFANLHEVFSIMQGGDTLIIRDGIYTGDLNTISNSHKPPDGTSVNYTVIKSENSGGVIFDGERQRFVFTLNTPLNYVQFEGIVWKNSTNGVVELSGGSHYVKFIRCGAAEMAPVCSGIFVVGQDCSYILYEECYTWGQTRYSFLAYRANHIIYRRCIARLDRSEENTEPRGALRNYSSDYVEWQNCIVIDFDTRDRFWVEGEPTYAAFYHSDDGSSGYPSENVFWRGCISLNNNCPSLWLGDVEVGPANKQIENCVFWDNWSGCYTQGEGNFNHIIVNSNNSGNDPNGIPLGYGIGCYSWHNLGNETTIGNSILYSSPNYGLRNPNPVTSSFISDYNCIYSNGVNYFDVTPGNHDYSIEGGNPEVDPLDGIPGNGIPSLKYLLCIEDGSDLDGVASNGGDIGATILYKIGVSGTLWGEPGHNTVTNEPLWPFPNEDIIKDQMKTYLYIDSITNDTLFGDRGFCSDGLQLNGVDEITLTSYIWEYLGNQMPDSIYTSVEENTEIINISTLTYNIFMGTNYITFNNLSTGDVIKIYNISGRLVDNSSEITCGSYRWNISDLPSGIYFFAINGDNEINGKVTIVK